ncbi:MAG TPA: sensor histidine kinase [Caulobacteraceae bacterium]|jgi:signal transduction histidine kinase
MTCERPVISLDDASLQRHERRIDAEPRRAQPGSTPATRWFDRSQMLSKLAELTVQSQGLSETSNAVAEERTRIAREIHDTLAQGLAAIRLQLELAHGDDPLPPQALEAIDLALQIANENFVEARRLISSLRSPRLCLATGLSATIERERRLGHAKMVATLEAVSDPPSEVAHELLRIAQEAIHNAAFHARPETIEVTLKSLPGRGLEITVTDDGSGFDPKPRTGGFGLAGMRERAAAILAELAIASTPGAGTRVTVSWSPLE